MKYIERCGLGVLLVSRSWRSVGRGIAALLLGVGYGNAHETHTVHSEMVLAARTFLSALTPSFMGANPARVPDGPLKGLRVLGREEDLARELLNSLSPDQRTKALMAKRPLTASRSDAWSLYIWRRGQSSALVASARTSSIQWVG